MYLTQKEQIEQELNEIKSHIEQSLTALDNLQSIHQKFSELEQNYQNLNNYLKQTQSQLQEFQQLQQRLESLEKLTELNWQQWNNELVKLQIEFDLAKQNLSHQFSQQINTLKQELEKQNLGEFKQQFKQDLEQALKQLGEAGFNPSNLKKLDKLGSQILDTRTYCLQLEAQLKTQKNWLVIAILTALMALGFSGALIIAQLTSQSNNDQGSTQSQGLEKPSHLQRIPIS